MRLTSTSVLASAGCLLLSCTSHAQMTARLDVRVSLDGVSWTNSLGFILPGTRVHCALFIGFTGGYGVSGAVYQIRNEGVGFAGDIVDISSPGLGRQGTFAFGAASQQVFVEGDQFRIDAAGDVANSPNLGIATAQNSPPNLGANFNSSNPALVYKFDIVTSALAWPWRTYNLEAPLSELKNGIVGIYSDANATRGTNVFDVTTDGASFLIAPAPGAAGPLAVGWLLGGRRRRGC